MEKYVTQFDFDKKMQELMNYLETEKKIHTEWLRVREEEKTMRRKEDEERRKEDKEKRKEEERQRNKEDKKFFRRMNKLEGNWGAFVESLVRPGIVDLFKKHDIFLRATYASIVERKNNQMYYEIDLLSINDKYAVFTETKATLRVADVDNHIERMEKIVDTPPHDFKLEGKTLLAAVAAVTIKEEADIYAQKKGLFVLKQEDSFLEITAPANKKEWKL